MRISFHDYDFFLEMDRKDEENDLKKKSLPKKLQKQRISVKKFPASFAFRKK